MTQVDLILERFKSIGVEIFLHPTRPDALRYRGKWEDAPPELVELLRLNKAQVIYHLQQDKKLAKSIALSHKHTAQASFDFLLEDLQVAVTNDLDIDKNAKKSKKIKVAPVMEVTREEYKILRRLRDSRRLSSDQPKELNHWLVNDVVRSYDRGEHFIYNTSQAVRVQRAIEEYGNCYYLRWIDEGWASGRWGKHSFLEANLIIEELIREYYTVKPMQGFVTVLTSPLHEGGEASIYTVKHVWAIDKDRTIIDPMWVKHPNCIFGYWRDR